MKINDIDFAIRFWVQDSDEKDIVEKVFADLYEMNDYIKRTWKEDEFDDAVQAQFSPVEIINGEPEEAVTFIFDICPYVELDEDEIEEFINNIEEAYSESERLTDRGNETKFIPLNESENYTDKKDFLSEIKYVCPHCFRPLDDCRCEHYPYFLVQVDKSILPIIKTLNQKGYITSSCCGGHIKADYCTSIYVAFDIDHEFAIEIPQSFRYSRSARTLTAYFDQNIDQDEFLVFQKNCLEELSQWAERLPSLH